MSAPRVLLDGLGIPESPRWHDGRLGLCNWTTGDIVTVGEDGVAEVAAHVETTVPYSIDWLPDGTLLVVSGQEASLLRRNINGPLAVYADLSAYGSVFNEIVVDAWGNAFVNGENIVAVRPDGSCAQVADGLRFGNGMAITPDGLTLIVAESHGTCLTAFTIGDGSMLCDRRIWADLDGDAPDGICLDADGAVWYASVPGRRCACAYAKAVRYWIVSMSIAVRSPACSAARDGASLFIAVAEWKGMDAIGHVARTGQILVEPVTVPHAGFP